MPTLQQSVTFPIRQYFVKTLNYPQRTALNKSLTKI